MLRQLIGENIDLAWLPGKDLGPVRMDPSQIEQMLANLCVNARDAIHDTGKITVETGIVTFDELTAPRMWGLYPASMCCWP
jgi:two-component system cell cycle sensor histidine kinase/response regulator CckA